MYKCERDRAMNSKPPKPLNSCISIQSWYLLYKFFTSADLCSSKTYSSMFIDLFFTYFGGFDEWQVDVGWLADLHRAEEWITCFPNPQDHKKLQTCIYDRFTQLIHVDEIHISLRSHPVTILMRCNIKTFSILWNRVYSSFWLQEWLRKRNDRHPTPFVERISRIGGIKIHHAMDREKNRALWPWQCHPERVGDVICWSFGGAWGRSLGGCKAEKLEVFFLSFEEGLAYRNWSTDFSMSYQVSLCWCFYII